MSILARLLTAAWPVRWAVIALLLGVTTFTAYIAVAYSLSDPQLAAWWPAAGIATAAGLLATPRERWVVIPLILAFTAVGNMMAGRTPLFSTLAAAGNTAEVVVLVVLLTSGGVLLRVSTLRQAVRFVIAALVGATVAGVIIAMVVNVYLGRELLEAFVQVSASHASATLVMLPLVLVPVIPRLGYRAGEVVAQSAFLATLIALVFGTASTWPIAFVPLVAILWSAFRFSMLVMSAQMLGTAVGVIALTTIGGGPFAAYDDASRTPIVLIQLFLLVYSISALLMSAARADWYTVVQRLRAQEELLREGIVAADVGIVIAERTDEGLREVVRNDQARRALGAAGPPFGVPEIDRLLVRRASGRVSFERAGHLYDASVAERSAHGGPGLVAIVLTDVTQRDRRERLALDSAEQLRHLNAQKDDFISSVSHELRTPVTSILGFSEVLMSSVLPAESAQASEVIGRNARRLADVINDVLELSTLGAVAGVTSTPTTVDLVALARQCVLDAAGLAINRSVTVDVEAPEGPVIVLSRIRDLERVCANLLSNAVKFSHDNGRVSVLVRHDGDGAQLEVIDRGIGLPAEHRDMVWDRFARAPLDAHRSITGTGLGLPIVRALVEQRLGGSVMLADTPEGGLTAVVRLPAIAPTEPSAQTLARGDHADRP